MERITPIIIGAACMVIGAVLIGSRIRQGQRDAFDVTRKLKSGRRRGEPRCSPIFYVYDRTFGRTHRSPDRPLRLTGYAHLVY